MAANADLSTLIPPPEEVNDTHKVYSIAAACITLGAISTSLVLLRLVHRWRSRTLGNDDYAMIPAIMLYIGWTVLAAVMNLRAGVGKPLWEITVREFEIWFQGILVSAWLYPIMSASIRVSIILFYQRIFVKRNSTGLKYAIWALLALQAIYIIVFSILPAFICDPVGMFWHPMVRFEYCNDYYYYYTQVALFSVSMAFDIILLLFPIFPVWNLQMPIRKRLGVVSIFMLGAGASVAAAYKLAIFVLEMERYKPTDMTWLMYLMSRFVPAQFDHYGVTFWIPTQVEPTVGLVGASLPALYHLFTISAQKIKTLNSTHSSRKTGSNALIQLEGSQPRERFQRINDSEVELRSMA